MDLINHLWWIASISVHFYNNFLNWHFCIILEFNFSIQLINCLPGCYVSHIFIFIYIFESRSYCIFWLLNWGSSFLIFWLTGPDDFFIMILYLFDVCFEILSHIPFNSFCVTKLFPKSCWNSWVLNKLAS